MGEVVDGLLQRIDRTAAEADGRFPMYADPRTGQWQWSADGGWFGGFWPGMLAFLLVCGAGGLLGGLLFRPSSDEAQEHPPRD